MAKYPPRRRRARSSPPEQIARGLGWFSIGIGVAQILAPRTVSRLVGVPMPPALTIACGLRELVCGIGILTQQQPRPWMQARIAGDALDLAGIGGALLLPGADRRRVAVAVAVVAGVTALDLYCSRELVKDRRRPPPRHVQASVHVDRPVEALYAFWRDLENLPRVIPHLESVEVLDDVRSHWVAKGAAGARVEWDSEIIDDSPNERLAWRSVEDSQVFSAGSVQFRRAASGGTDVTVEVLYASAADSLGEAIATLFGRTPGREVRADLRAFKAIMERGPPLQSADF